jgi:predicted nucleic acid-binding Zn ribbon protein
MGVKMVEKLLQHRHCIVCGKAVPSEEELCSDKCSTERDSITKKKRGYVYLMYGAIIVMIIFLVLSFVFGR